MASESNGNGLVIDRLRIQGFRVFEDVEFERFGRVNLITGRNGVGKTALLEAIQVFASLAEPQVLRRILRSRDEERPDPAADTWQLHNNALKCLFRRELGGHSFSIAASNRKIEGEFGWYRELQAESGIRFERVRRNEIGREGAIGIFEIRYLVPTDPDARIVRRIIPERRFFEGMGPPLGEEMNCEFVGASGIVQEDLGPLWRKIALSPFEDDIVAALRNVIPDLARITIAPEGHTAMPLATLRGFDAAVPLRSLGDGVMRILGIGLALGNAKDGVLLIDEVENGIHYTAQEQLWQFLVDASRRLNVQVFATTHSSDAVHAFQAATLADPEVEGVLTRLEMRKGKIRVAPLNEDELKIAVHEAIEVR